MKTSMIENQIENSKDPFIIFQVTSFNSEEEMENIESNLDQIFTLEELEKINNLITTRVSPNVDYMIIKQSEIEDVKFMLNKCNISFTINDITNNIWELNNIKEFVSLFGEEDPSPELTQQIFPDIQSTFSKVYEILKLIVESKYSTDDVLDVISEKGINSLNELHKYILEKESR